MKRGFDACLKLNILELLFTFMYISLPSLPACQAGVYSPLSRADGIILRGGGSGSLPQAWFLRPHSTLSRTNFIIPCGLYYCPCSLFEVSILSILLLAQLLISLCANAAVNQKVSYILQPAWDLVYVVGSFSPERYNLPCYSGPCIRQILQEAGQSQQ